MKVQAHGLGRKEKSENNDFADYGLQTWADKHCARSQSQPNTSSVPGMQRISALLMKAVMPALFVDSKPALWLGATVTWLRGIATKRWSAKSGG